MSVLGWVSKRDLFPVLVPISQSLILVNIWPEFSSQPTVTWVCAHPIPSLSALARQRTTFSPDMVQPPHWRWGGQHFTPWPLRGNISQPGHDQAKQPHIVYAYVLVLCKLLVMENICQAQQTASSVSPIKEPFNEFFQKTNAEKIQQFSLRIHHNGTFVQHSTHKENWSEEVDVQY